MTSRSVASSGALRIVSVSVAALFWTSNAEAACTSVDISSGPAAYTQATGATFQFSQTGSHCAGVFDCRLDGGSWSSCSSPKSYSSLSNGQHTFVVRHAISTSITDTWVWTVDTVAPNTTLLTGPTDYTNDPKPTFTFSSNESGTFECRVDAGAWSACTSPHTTALLTEAAHRFDVRAKDLALNVDATPAGQSITVGRSGGADFDGMWTVGSTGIDKWGFLDADDPVSILTISTANTKAHAVDVGGENYWILSWDAILRSYDFEGNQKVSVTPPTTPGGGDKISLEVDFKDGSVMLAFGTKLYHYSETGSLVRTTTFSDSVQAIAIDARVGHTIVVRSNSVVGIDRDDGSTTFTISLSGGTSVGVDPFTGEFWVSFASTIRQYSSSGSELNNVSLSGGAGVAIDGLNGAWVASGASLESPRFGGRLCSCGGDRRLLVAHR